MLGHVVVTIMAVRYYAGSCCSHNYGREILCWVIIMAVRYYAESCCGHNYGREILCWVML